MLTTYGYCTAMTSDFWNNGNPMNIFIPDRWLRQHLKTNATIKQIREYLSLCGPSIERVDTIGKDSVYDIEVTTNRVDMMSVRGIAQEASVILPQFGIQAELLPLPTYDKKNQSTKPLGITIENDPKLCKRIIAVKLENISLKQSSKEMKEFLTLAGIKPTHAAIDITNYVMHEVGYPIHAFDYDRLKEKHIVVREARRGEHFITLDGKKHITQGDEIVFEDGKGTIIDLPAIMGCENTSVHDDTTSILLWAESADPMKIRQASMGLGIRSQAAVINEKHPDPEMAMDSIQRAIRLYSDIFDAKVGSRIEDIYPMKEHPVAILLDYARLTMFLGEQIPIGKTQDILTRLGCSVKVSKRNTDVIFSVTPPSWRHDDMGIAEDVIEEVARIYGYHRIAPVLPPTSAIPKAPEPLLVWEKRMKSNLAGFGYTELYTYSMVSNNQLENAGFDPKQTYRITNPLVSDHEYMRPSLIPGVIKAIAQNIAIQGELKFFELSNIYRFQEGTLPHEERTLLVVQTGNMYRQLKGIAETLFDQMGIPFPTKVEPSDNTLFDPNRSLKLDGYGSIGFIRNEYIQTFQIRQDIVALELSFDELVRNQNYHVSYKPLSKYPSIVEDLSFTVPHGFLSGPFLATLKQTDKRILSLTLQDIYHDTRTVRVVYNNDEKNLTNEDIKPIREKLIRKAQESFSAFLRTE